MAHDVSLPAEIGKAALLSRNEYEIRDWLLLRMASNGQGHCRELTFRAFLGKHFRRTHMSTITNRLVSSGLARRTRTKLGDSVLKPLSIARVLSRYDLPKSTYSVNIPLEALVLRGWRNALCAFVEVGLGDTPMARATVESLTGVSKPTQRRGERKIGAHVQENYARIELSDIEHAASVMPCSSGNGGRRAFRRDQSLYIQIANTITHPSRQRNRRVRYARGKCAEFASQGNCPSNAGGQPTSGTRYFATMRKARTTRRNGHCWLKSPQGKEILPAYLDEGADRLGTRIIGVWGEL